MLAVIGDSDLGLVRCVSVADSQQTCRNPRVGDACAYDSVAATLRKPEQLTSSPQVVGTAAM
jgi:hypothetical protein